MPSSLFAEKAVGMTVDKVPLTIFPTKYFGDPEVERSRIVLAVHISSGVENLPHSQYAPSAAASTTWNKLPPPALNAAVSEAY